jgi:hypothetical protein
MRKLADAHCVTPGVLIDDISVARTTNPVTEQEAEPVKTSDRTLELEIR